MKCRKCGEKLDMVSGKSVNFCSNCGEKVAVKTAEDVINSADATLRYIADNFGTDALLGSKIVSTFADVTRNQLKDEKDLIKILSEKGALECLKDALQKPASEQEIAIKRAIAKLPKFLQGSEDADAMLRIFAAALGWQLPKQQTADAPEPVVRQAKHQSAKLQQTPNVILPNLSAESVNLSVRPSVGSIIKVADIDWRVLADESDKVLLISERILEKRPYDYNPFPFEYGDTTWEACTLRRYLNGEFYISLGATKSAIAETCNSNPNNPWFGTSGGNATNDKVFLLSLDEVCRYFGDSTTRLSKKGGTRSIDYFGDKNNPKRIANYVSEGASWWWLRSPGFFSSEAADVHTDGDVVVRGRDVRNGSGGVRPALWLNLQSFIKICAKRR